MELEGRYTNTNDRMRRGCVATLFSECRPRFPNSAQTISSPQCCYKTSIIRIQLGNDQNDPGTISCWLVFLHLQYALALLLTGCSVHEFNRSMQRRAHIDSRNSRGACGSTGSIRLDTILMDCLTWQNDRFSHSITLSPSIPWIVVHDIITVVLLCCCVVNNIIRRRRRPSRRWTFE
jgi:hypothetical protein